MNQHQPKMAIIGGTGLTQLSELEITGREVMHTPYGEPSGLFTYGLLNQVPVVFLARHGYSHRIPPHMVNYRANIWAIKNIGVEKILAVAAVGGINKGMYPGRLSIPDQIIDYTYSREHTFFSKNLTHVTHIDFSNPYDEEMRKMLIHAAGSCEVETMNRGVYGATQGPRLETAAEINRMERDGCDMVGMTGMPEASLARELELSYATCAVSANWAAGRGDSEITMDNIQETLTLGMQSVARILRGTVQLVD
jgi:5'-methylthioinosine phosphorylase